MKEEKYEYMGKENTGIVDILHFVRNYVYLTVKLLPILVKQNRRNTTAGSDPFFCSEARL